MLLFGYLIPVHILSYEHDCCQSSDWLNLFNPKNDLTNLEKKIELDVKNKCSKSV